MTLLTEILAIIDEARTRNDANEIVATYKKYGSVELPPAYFVRKASAIQLSDGIEYTIEEAEGCLQKAIALDQYFLEEYGELGHIMLFMTILIRLSTYSTKFLKLPPVLLMKLI